MKLLGWTHREKVDWLMAVRCDVKEKKWRCVRERGHAEPHITWRKNETAMRISEWMPVTVGDKRAIMYIYGSGGGNLSEKEDNEGAA